MAKLFIAILVGFGLVSWLTGFINGSGGLVAANLTSPISATATTIPVVSTDGFSTSGLGFIQDETFSYTGVDPTNFTGVTRGVENTVAVAHPLYSQGLYVKVYTEEASGINRAMGFDAGATMSQWGIAGLPIIAWDFFSKTLPMIIAWQNLDFLTGPLAIIRTILILISSGLAIALAIMGLSSLTQPKVRP